MKPNDPTEEVVFTTGTRLSDSSSWFNSLVRQVRELREERRNPQTPVEITAKRDPEALQKLVVTDSPIRSLLSDVKSVFYEWRHPRKIETSATPIEVEELWSEHRVRVPGLLSLVGHVSVVVLLLIPWATSIKAPKQTVTDVVLYTPAPVLTLPKLPQKSGGGGGGGMRTPTPPSLGRPPRGADKQLVPPTPEVKNLAPELIAEPTIVAPQLANLPQISLLPLGDPDGVPGPPSAGPGSGGGIGTGTGRGVGSGNGPGLGPGEGGGTGGGPYRLGTTAAGGITNPSVIYRVEPQYSEDARKARYQGTVTLEAIVHKDGTVEIVRVVRPVGYGLDENAQRALRQWKFKPAMKNGQPVDVVLNVEVNFNLR
jgi:TonB family protein